MGFGAPRSFGRPEPEPEPEMPGQVFIPPLQLPPVQVPVVLVVDAQSLVEVAGQIEQMVKTAMFNGLSAAMEEFADVAEGAAEDTEDTEDTDDDGAGRDGEEVRRG